MNILIIGNGGREHAIAWKLEQNKNIEKIFCINGNAAEKLLTKTKNIKLNNPKDINEYVKFAIENKIDLTIVGSEELLVRGIVDKFKKNKLKIFGPNKTAAKLEGSKVFSKEFMEKYGIKTAKYKKFDKSDQAIQYLNEENMEFPIVVKADGLAAGKGVIIAQNIEEAIGAVKILMIDKKFNDSGNKIVIEEYLIGKEVSILSFTDCNVILPFISAKDHKKIGENETGLNTGGMGVVAPNPYYTKNIENEFIEKILKPTLEGLKKEKMDFEGVIFFGLMITKKGVYLLEYNMRLGDPETQAVLPLLENNLLELIEKALIKRLHEIQLKFKKMHSCCVVLAAGGYPEKYETGNEIVGINDVINNGSNVFICGANIENDKIVTNGGRVLNIVSLGETLEDAQNKAYENIKNIKFKDMYFRKDIGR